MSDRPEYVTCVADTEVGREGLTWCGRRHSLEFAFANVDHAALNGRQRGRLVVCPECLSAITVALNAGDR